jgi:succinylarginine dihydrolase
MGLLVRDRPLQGPDRALAHKRQSSQPYNARQILQRLRELGFDGGRSIVKDEVARIQPRPQLASSSSTSPQASAPR